jgi:tRNA A-37 threonylcarbamoyl transferase component Bud32
LSEGAANGDELLHAAEAALRAGSALALRDDAVRGVFRLEVAGRPALLKRFHVGVGARALRERWKARLGAAPAQREWRALGALHAAGLAVPAPLARGAAPDGDRLVAMEWIEGVALPDALRAPPARRRALLASLGELVAGVHRAGWAHGDLHAGNVRVARGVPWLLDWQRSRRTNARGARQRDLAFLEESLVPYTSRADRMRVRRAALGVRRPLGREARAALRAAGEAVARRARERAASRMRDALREGRIYARAEWAGARGMRLRALPTDAAASALRQHAEAVAAHDARLLDADARAAISAVALGEQRAVVKETPWRGPLRALADLARGSPARRAWLAAHGLRARGLGAPRPLAYLERRRLGLPVASWLVLEDLRPAMAANLLAARAEEALDALARLLVELHRAGVDHGDLKATNVLLDAALGPALVDLEAVRFRRRVPDARRLAALAELNASLPDAFPAAARRRAFDRYVRALPFAMGRARALAQIVRASLERRHRWTGQDCDLAREADQPRSTLSHWK